MSSRYLIKNASISTFWRALGTASGAVLDAVILAHFGLGAETDALFVSLAIPSLITSALEVQAPKILIPAFTRSTEAQGSESTSKLVSKLFTTMGAILCGIALVFCVFARTMVRVQAPGFHASATHIGVRLFSILAWLTLFQGVAPVLQSFLYSRHRYLVPSLSKLMTSLPAIIVISVYHSSLGIYAAAIGMVAGSVLQLLLLNFTASRHGLIWKRPWRTDDTRMSETLRMFVHPMVGHVLGEGKTIVENFLASLLGGGSLSVLRYASRIIEAISGVLLGGIVTSSLPLISAYASERRLIEMKSSVLDAIRLITFLALPISCWLLFTGQPMIVLLFQRGRFSGADATHTALLIALMTPYVIFSRVIGITQTPFYAKLDTKTPLVSVILFFSVYIVLVWLLSRTLGVYGFPIASSVASVMTTVTMSALLHRTFGPLGWKSLSKFGFRMALVMGITICAFALGRTLVGQFQSETLADKLIRFLTPTALGFAAFLAASVAFRLLKTRHLEALVGG